MPRNPTTGSYTYPSGIEGIPDQTIISEDYNHFLMDVQFDLNAPRPIVAGGTGGTSAITAMQNLHGEITDQVIANFDSDVLYSGSFSSASSASGGPVASHAFSGIIYRTDTDNIVIEARDHGDTIVPGRLYIREKKAGVWGVWTQNSGVVINDGGEVVLPPVPPPVNPTDATNKAYVDAVDAQLNNAINFVNDNANNRVLRSGDSMTGPLNAPHFNSTNNAYYFGASNYLNFTGAFNFNAGLNCGGLINCSALACGPVTCGAVYATGTSRFVDHVLIEGAGQPCFAVHNQTAHIAWGFWVDTSPTASMNFGNTDVAGNPFALRMSLSTSGTLTISGNGYKPGGGSWADSSDSRIKNVLGDYDTGLDAVAGLNPVRFTFKGNDTATVDSRSMHQDVADAGTEFIGLIAQEANAAMPELVTTRAAYIDGVAVTDLHMLDTTALVYALINSIKELKARVEALEAV